MSYEKFRHTVVTNIKNARKKANLTQEDMARFGFNVRHYQDIEAGKIHFTLETLYRIGKALKIKPEELIKN